MSTADVPQSNSSQPALSQQQPNAAHPLSPPQLGDAATQSPSATNSLFTPNPDDHPQGIPQVKSEIRMGALDVSSSLSQLVEALREETLNAAAHPPVTDPVTNRVVPSQLTDLDKASVSTGLTGDQAMHSNPKNAALLEQLAQLEMALDDYEARLNAHSHPASQPPVSNQPTDPTQGNHANGEQIQPEQLMMELMVANQITQHQQSLIELLTAELQVSRQQLSTLEQEYRLAQQQAEKTGQLLSDQELACGDLRSRLHRQQRYTLQFKAALEKCLDLSGARQDGSASGNLGQEDANPGARFDDADSLLGSNPLKSQVFLPKMKPIQPWSTPPVLFGEDSSNLDDREYGVELDQASQDDVDWLYFVNEPVPTTDQVMDIFATASPAHDASVNIDHRANPDYPGGPGDAPSSSDPNTSNHSLSQIEPQHNTTDAMTLDAVDQDDHQSLGDDESSLTLQQSPPPQPSISFTLRSPKPPSAPQPLDDEGEAHNQAPLASSDADITLMPSRSTTGDLGSGDQPSAVTDSVTLEWLSSDNPHHNTVGCDPTPLPPFSSSPTPILDAVMSRLGGTDDLNVDLWADLVRVVEAPASVEIAESSLLQTLATSQTDYPGQAVHSPTHSLDYNVVGDSLLVAPMGLSVSNQETLAPTVEITERSPVKVTSHLSATSTLEAQTRLAPVVLNTPLSTFGPTADETPRIEPQLHRPVGSSRPGGSHAVNGLGNGYALPRYHYAEKTVSEKPSLSSPPYSRPETIATSVSQASVPQATEQPMPFQVHATWPSPTVQSSRPLKKRTSLASVELPSFPRLQQR